jgi:tetratricopeptide (TPR) repeat protein
MKQKYQVRMQYAEALRLSQEGDILVTQRSYSQAISKFHAAIERCPALQSQAKIDIMATINETMDKWSQFCFFKGTELFIQGRFRDASDQFKLAHEKAVNDEKNNKYLREMNHADAMVLSQEGDELVAQKNFSEAFDKYQEVVDRCPTSQSQTKTSIMDKIYSTIDKWAESHYQEGIELINQRDFKAAIIMIRTAIDKVLDDDKKQQYQAEIVHVEALALSSEGDELTAQGNYIEAVKKHRAAIDHCPTSHEAAKTTVKAQLAETFYKHGVELLNEGSFKVALYKFLAAKETSADDERTREIDRKISECQAEILQCEGDGTFDYC